MCIVPFVNQPGIAQTSEDVVPLKKQMDTLEDNQKETLKQLEAIRVLLATRQINPSPTLTLESQDTPARGSQTAKLILVEYFDYECPFCASFFDETMPQLTTDYISSGMVRFIARDFPLEPAHPLAL